MDEKIHYDGKPPHGCKADGRDVNSGSPGSCGADGRGVNSGSPRGDEVPSWGIDLHVHTTFSPDSQVDPERACKAAVARDIKIMGFADHAEFVKGDEAFIEVVDQRKIQAEIAGLRSLYGDRLEILYGVEVGYIPGKEREIRGFLDSHPFDYAIGSVHYVDGVLVSRWIREQEEKGLAFAPYFEALFRAAESGLFQILGHLDYVRKYMFAPHAYRHEEYLGIVERILKLACERELALELNTSGWRHFTAEPYPGPKILESFRGSGGYVTVGSDAHKYYEVGYGLARAKKLLRDCGFTSLETFRDRKRLTLSL